MSQHPSYTNEFRILKYLRENKPRLFMAADIAKALDLTSPEVGSSLRDVPGVRILKRARCGRNEAGHQWTFEEPGWQ